MNKTGIHRTVYRFTVLQSKYVLLLLLFFSIYISSGRLTRVDIYLIPRGNTHGQRGASHFRTDVASGQRSAQVILHSVKHFCFHHVSNVLVWMTERRGKNAE